MTGNGECDGSKTERIGQSAAKHLSNGEGSETIESGLPAS